MLFWGQLGRKRRSHLKLNYLSFFGKINLLSVEISPTTENQHFFIQGTILLSFEPRSCAHELVRVCMRPEIGCNSKQKLVQKPLATRPAYTKRHQRSALTSRLMTCPQGRRRRGGIKKLRAMETYKKPLPICLFLFSNNVGLKVLKTILNFLGSRIAATNLFKIVLDNPWNDLWYCYEKGTSAPVAPLLKGQGGNARHVPASLLCAKEAVTFQHDRINQLVHRTSFAVAWSGFTADRGKRAFLTSLRVVVSSVDQVRDCWSASRADVYCSTANLVSSCPDTAGRWKTVTKSVWSSANAEVFLYGVMN